MTSHTDSLNLLLTDDKLDDLWREACRDDWHLRIVGSEVRGLIAEIRRLRQPEPVSINAGAKAIAWDDLTPTGQQECNWPKDYHESEVKKYKAEAIACADAWGLKHVD